MGTRFDPADWLARVLPKNFEKSGLLSENLSIKQKYLKALVRATSLSGKEITEEVYKMVDFYEKKEAELKAEGVRAYKQEALNGQALLKQRIKNMLVYTEVQEQRKAHKGQWYRWLPSNATTPDPEHALLYGKIFREGTGDKNNNMPGERYGCQCGIEWVTDADTTDDEKTHIAIEDALAQVNNQDIKQAEYVFDLATKGKKGERKLRKCKPISFKKVQGVELKKLNKVSGENLKDAVHQIIPIGKTKGFRRGVAHIFDNHGNPVREAKRKIPQIAVTGKDIALIPYIVRYADSVVLSPHVSGRMKEKVLIYRKIIGKREYFYLEYIQKGKPPVLGTQTMYIQQK